MPDSKGQFMSNTVSHFKRASNHNVLKRVYDNHVTVSHFKRASNHNGGVLLLVGEGLFHISKEHQITTESRGFNRRGELFHISKEHQITTRVLNFITLVKLFHISKEHQITTPRRRCAVDDDCFTFQKSIKSQRCLLM